MPTPPAFDAHRLIALGRVTSVAPSPDGTWLAVAVSRHDADKAKYVSDLWRVALDGAREPARLTRGRSNDRAPAFRADGSLGFLSDRNPREGDAEDGDESRSQVWLLPAEGGEPRPLTDEPLGVSAFRFAARGDRLVVIADVLPDVPHGEQRKRAADLESKGPTALHYTRMPVRYWDHWLPRAAPHAVAYDGEGRGRRDLTPTADREHRDTATWDLSADGALAVLTEAHQGADRIDEHALRIVETASGRARSIGRSPLASLESPRVSPDGARVACVRHQRSKGAFGKPTLWVFELATGEGHAVADGWDAWPHLHGWTEDGAQLLVTADERGLAPVFAVDARSGEVARVTARSAGGTHECVAQVPGARAIVGVRSRIVHPPEPFRAALAPEGEPALLANLSGLTEEAGRSVARFTSLETPSSDGASVQSFLVTPANAREGARLPTLLWIHGGPRSHWSDGWHWRWNPLVAAARGYAVALPNPRGSTGFGQAFLEGIWGNAWGAQCYRDVVAVADALAQNPACDGERMAAMGGSFGGYMTNWLGANTQRFKCLVTHASLYALSAFHGVTDVPAWWAHEMGGAPYEDDRGYDRYSPHRLVRGWKTPTLVVHGEKDYRVPVSEALALFEALQAHGVESELLVFPDEGHWILRPRNSVEWYERVLGWLGRHLG